MSKHHDLKIYSEYFRLVWDNKKTFEIRKNDRDFKVGDSITLHAINRETGEYTGSVLARRINYMTDFEQKEGYVVLGLETYCRSCGHLIDEESDDDFEDDEDEY